MANKKAAEHNKPTLAHDRALNALQKQLVELAKLKQRNYQDAELDETQWEHLTQSIVEAAFGKESSNLSKFYGAKWAGVHNVMGISPQQRQINFESRIREYDVLLRSLINELRLYLPEEEIKGVYAPGEEYEFYHDLSSLIAEATHEVFIVDAYLAESVFNLYVGKVLGGVGVRILSNNVGANVETVAKMYATTKRLELRSSGGVHDRAVFLDQRGWVVGQSIKDAAKRKPTYMIELTEPSLAANRDVHDAIWRTAKVII
jgi:hypothetical protein